MRKRIVLSIVLACALVAAIQLGFRFPVFDIGPYVSIAAVALIATVSIDDGPGRWAWFWLGSLLLLAFIMYANGRSDGAHGALLVASGILAAMIVAWRTAGRHSIPVTTTP